MKTKLTVGFQALALLMIILLAAACGGSPSSRTTAQPSMRPVTLTCTDCADAGILINVWQNPGLSRGRVVFQVPHNTVVNMLDSKSADDGRQWYYVESGGKKAWIAADFVTR